MSRGISQDTSFSFPRKLDNGEARHRCFECFSLAIRGRGRPSVFHCIETGELIEYPVSGPVGSRCPLPEYRFPGEEDADDPGL
jgi:hypothetical protein